MENQLEIKKEMENYFILRMKKDGVIISGNQITAEAANAMIDFITEVYENETGGITINLDVELFNETKGEDYAAE
jgi:hypothetical protein